MFFFSKICSTVKLKYTKKFCIAIFFSTSLYHNYHEPNGEIEAQKEKRTSYTNYGKIKKRTNFERAKTYEDLDQSA